MSCRIEPIVRYTAVAAVLRMISLAMATPRCVLPVPGLPSSNRQRPVWEISGNLSAYLRQMRRASCWPVDSAT
ncbi:hypothetical protein D3C84_888640 [compost metagenome]